MYFKCNLLLKVVILINTGTITYPTVRLGLGKVNRKGLVLHHSMVHSCQLSANQPIVTWYHRLDIIDIDGWHGHYSNAPCP